jgi:putative molybdopterin biosynthesis protein
MSEQIYLYDIPLDAARARFQQALAEVGLWSVLGAESIPLDEHAVGRILAEPVWARISSPPFHIAAMDGFGLRSAAIAGATTTLPVDLEAETEAVYLDTGQGIPDWVDTIVPIEDVEPLDETGKPAPNPRRPRFVRIRQALPPWTNIRPMGEDIVETELVRAAGAVLRPVDLGAIAAAGHTRVNVSRRPRVAILPTGNELIPLGESPKPGNSFEFNSLVLASQVLQWGGQPKRFPITRDNLEQISAQVKKAASESDLVLLNAGSSAGSKDFSARVIESLGRLLVHGIAVRPGHPVILGLVHNEPTQDTSDQEGQTTKEWVPIIGVPGFPVSAALTGEIFVEPLLARWLGRKPLEQPKVQAFITRKVTSPAGDDDYLRVAVGKVGDRVLAAPLPRGAGVITSLVRADGIVVIPSGVQGVSEGEEVTVNLYAPPEDIERTIFAIGSHDMTLDLMSQFLAQKDRRLVSANVGSLGGLLALRRGQAHLAGSHLLDPDTGEYNLRYIAEYLPGVPVWVVTLVGREQGLMVRHGNPKGILTLADLAREDVTFINRQRGAGTRVLLDYHLGKLGIEADGVKGYEQEEYTHLAVAAAVASGRADCGLGIAAAAQALDLDFITLFQERYDLIIPAEYAEGDLLKPLFEVLQDAAFRDAVAKMPGYDVSHMGQVVAKL